jgi:hypothetical protein
MKKNMTTSELIQSHTLLPYFSAFLPEDRTQFVQSAMRGVLGSAVNARLGLLASSVKIPPYLRVCEQCMIEDERAFGLPYWHRSHQLPGVFVCYKHECVLEDSVIPYSLRRNKHEYISLKHNLVRKKADEHQSRHVQCNHLNFLAKQSHILLNLLYESGGLKNVIKTYRARLYELGFITPSGSIRFQALRSKLYDTVGYDLLCMCQSEVNKDSQDTWLHKILRGGEHIHTLRHLIMMLFLGQTIDSILEMHEEGYHPFGVVPWPCLNKTADHFREEIISQCEVSLCSDTGRPVGTFTCDCGFIYSRRGPDLNDFDRNKIGRIKQYGSVWERKFEEFQFRSDLSLRQKAELLGIHRSTLYLKKKHVLVVKPKVVSSEILNISLEGNPSAEDLPNITINSIRFRSSNRNENHARVNWEARDRELLPLIHQAVRDIKSASDKPIRVTLPEIGRRIGKLSLLEKKLFALPRCKALLVIEVETKEQFQIRRVELAAQKLFQAEQSVVKWKLIRNAGLRKETAWGLGNEIDKVISYYHELKAE